MICGSGSFSHMDDFSGEIPRGGADQSAPSTPKGSRRKRENKNPFATRGLDKFSTVLAELEARREKILPRANANGASLVRFMYTNSNDWIPVVVRIPDPEGVADKTKNKKNVKDKEVSEMYSMTRSEPSSLPPSSEAPKVMSVELVEEKSRIVEKMKLRFAWPPANLKPTCYWPAVVILILFCLVVFGRVFAICCTSVCWYLMPTIQEYVNGGTSRRSSMKKKDYKSKPSYKKLVVVGNGR